MPGFNREVYDGELASLDALFKGVGLDLGAAAVKTSVLPQTETPTGFAAETIARMNLKILPEPLV